MSDERLKPCPFCGGEATIHKSKFGYGVMCKTPFCCDLTAAHATEKDAIKMWNTRQAEPVAHGRWKGYTFQAHTGMDEYGEPKSRDCTAYRCSECGRRTAVKSNYCPNCGAKMDLDRGDQNE